MNKHRKRALIVLASAMLIGIVIGLSTWQPNEETVYPTFSFETWNQTERCKNLTNEYGIVISLNETLGPLEKKAFLHGFVYRFVSSDEYRKNLIKPMLTIYLRCANQTKRYYDYKDFPEGDDCIDENHCFVKWVDANVSNGEVKG